MRKQDQKGHNPPTWYSKPEKLLLQEVCKIVLQKNWTRSTLFKYNLRWWPWFHFDASSLNIHWRTTFIPDDSNLWLTSSRLLLLSVIPRMAAVVEIIPIPTEQQWGSLCLKTTDKNESATEGCHQSFGGWQSCITRTEMFISIMLIYERPKSSSFLHQYPSHKVTEHKQDIFAST